MGSEWVHLRYCLTCGVTLCCDSSPNTHMTKHNHKTAHPVVQSIEPGESWLFCYPEQIVMESGKLLGEKKPRAKNATA
jgi:Zn-finger in ubiquitin-hydrolases and other protein